MISIIKSFFKKDKSPAKAVPAVQFDINSVYHKLYEANYDKEVTLTKEEAGELLDYLDYAAWRINSLKK